MVNQRRSSIQSIKSIINLLKYTSPIQHIIDTDISEIRTILTHRMTDGSEGPIGYVSLSLTSVTSKELFLVREGRYVFLR